MLLLGEPLAWEMHFFSLRDECFSDTAAGTGVRKGRIDVFALAGKQWGKCMIVGGGQQAQYYLQCSLLAFPNWIKLNGSRSSD